MVKGPCRPITVLDGNSCVRLDESEIRTLVACDFETSLGEAQTLCDLIIKTRGLYCRKKTPVPSYGYSTMRRDVINIPEN
jgi:hypothetical protein